MRPWQPVSFIAAESLQAATNTIEIDWKHLNWRRVREGEWRTPDNEIVRYLRTIDYVRAMRPPVRVYTGYGWNRNHSPSELFELEQTRRVVVVDPMQDDLSEPAADVPTCIATDVCNLPMVREMCGDADRLTDLHGLVQEIVLKHTRVAVVVVNSIKGDEAAAKALTAIMNCTQPWTTWSPLSQRSTRPMR